MDKKQRTANRHKGIAQILLLAGGILLLAGIYASATSSKAIANSTDMSNAETQYASIVGTRIDACSLCHSSVPSLNSYGSAYKAAGRNTAALAAIEGQDADGDGFTNLQEINALTFPGDASDFPAGNPTATRTATATATLTATSEATATLTATSQATATRTATATQGTPVTGTATATRTPTKTGGPKLLEVLYIPIGLLNGK